VESKAPQSTASRPRICVDLDGTLARFTEWRGITHIGHPHAGARHFLEELRKVAHVVIHTCRCNPSIQHGCAIDELRRYVQEWLEEHELPYDEIYTGAGKPFASAYIDDRAIQCDPQADNFAYHRALLELHDMLAERR